MKLIAFVFIALTSSHATGFVWNRRNGLLHTPSTNSLRHRPRFDISIMKTSMSVDQEAWNDIPSPNRFLALSSDEILINMLQATLFLLLVRIFRISSVTISVSGFLLRHLPNNNLVEHEVVSVMNWIVHCSPQAYNVGIIRSLLEGDANTDVKARRAYAVAISGLGQLFGTTTLLAHSQIGVSAAAEQALHNFSHFAMTLSTMSIGGLIALPTALGVASSFAIGGCIAKGFVSFYNLPGKILSSLGALAVCSRDFPLKFKLTYCGLAMSPLVERAVFRLLPPETDLAHMVVAAWVAACIFIQKWSLDEEKNTLTSSSGGRIGRKART